MNSPIKRGEFAKKLGSVKNYMYRKNALCTDCKGVGTIENNDINPLPTDPDKFICDTCAGTGRVYIETDVNIYPFKP